MLANPRGNLTSSKDVLMATKSPTTSTEQFRNTTSNQTGQAISPNFLFGSNRKTKTNAISTSVTG